ncbi:FadD3 family acyl-CoA ligase [Jatrophihabitans cynanchi]|jgi:acyl-CoA synthetase (AMP-forming)/AMP-acid ligase II|uniref:FadD3 family acyl-CoA ligase n=1 Tax=Jatrophihabitans cynanchi TaxID=2944128 RepID=A0ABY7JV92_9ACTN|nr:FadD3 family acyl-CoA ligase [Jatrophihabitans sp. SB3-54]WAX56284.1 FadD3 family acyl-CoA ligase [Jatrophihabitans sp. SB3-54]
MPGSRTIPDVLAHARVAYGGQEAFIDDDVRWTFAELGEQVQRCAAAMIASGVRHGDRVALWAPNGHRFVVASLGAVMAGAVLVPVNTRYKGDEARWIIGKSGARLLLVDNGFLGNDYLAMLRASAPDDGHRPVVGLPALAEVIDLHAGAGDWQDFLARAESVPVADVLNRAAQVTPDDLSDMFFTSGTTGRPKGVMTTHGQNIRVYDAWIDGVGLRQGDRYLLINPLFHTFGYKAGLLACLIQGATIVSQPVFDVERALAAISAEQITVVPGPPTLYSSMLDHPARERADLGSLRLAITGASVVPVALVERMRTELFPKVVIAYGMTESCGTATVGDPDADSETIARTVGTAIEGTEVIVADAEGRPLPPEQSGEVLVRGYNVMRGYFDDPDATAAAIDADGWLHTGDVGVIRPDGNLRITDRLKDMFVVGGFNAYPAEIEQAITRHEKVSEAAVIGVPDERLGEVCRAYVIPRPGMSLSEAEIIAFCRERLANFKVPASVVIVDALPRNASGKVLKFELRRDAHA